MLQSHWEKHGLQNMNKITATMCNEVVTMLPLKLLQRLDASVWGGRNQFAISLKLNGSLFFVFLFYITE